MKLKERIRRIEPYTPGEQPQGVDIIKLNTNECPYPPSPAFGAALGALDPAAFARYPDPGAGALVEALSEVYGMPREQIFVGVGSDEVLALAFQTFFGSCSGEEPLLFPDVTYSFYPVWADLYRVPFREVPVDDGFRLRAEDYGIPAGGVIFPNPNAPTGLCEPLAFVEEILRAHRDCVVIVDEAYIDFGGTSALSLIQGYDNLLVVQTCSKSRSLAGLRVGFAFGSRVLIDALKAVKFSFNSYTMNRASLGPGAAAIRDTAYFRETCGRIVRTRERMAEGLRRLGFSFPESQANFLFARHDRRSGQELYETLRERGIYVRHWQKPRIGEYLRITVGTEEQTDALLTALEEIVG